MFTHLLCQVQENITTPLLRSNVQDPFSQYTLQNLDQQWQEQAAPNVFSISFVIHLFHVHVEVRTLYTKLIYNNFISLKKRKQKVPVKNSTNRIRTKLTRNSRTWLLVRLIN